jgi:hypothetical protein
MKKLRLISAVRKARREGKIAVSAQETIPYVEMYKDGLCKVS